MANYSNLKTAIENAVDWNNGDNEITGQNLLDILETIIDSLGAKYKFADVATPSSSITTPDEPLFYLAGAGTYTNFSDLSVTIPRGTLAIFYYDTAWHYTTVRTDSDAFFNVNQYLGTPSTTYTKANGRNAVPSALRSKGMIITYLTTNGWIIEQNLSTSGTWNADANWQTIGPVSVSQNTLMVGDTALGELAGQLIENPEWVQVVTDSEDKVLEGIKKDGTKVIGGDVNVGGDAKILGDMDVSGVSYKVFQNPEYLAAWVDSEGRVIFGLKSNGKTYIGDADFLTDIKAIKAFLPEEINMNIDWDALSSITTVENPEFVNVEIDADGKILSSRDCDGVKHEEVGFETPKLSIDGASIDNIEDPEGRTEILTDSEGKVLSYRGRDGVKHEEAGVATKEIYTDAIKLSDEGMTEFQQALKDAGFQPGGSGDYTDKNNMYIPEPRLAHLNIITDFDLTTLTKTSDVKCQVEFIDSVGNYFKKWVILNGQGRSSLDFVKKGLGVDFFNEDPNAEDFDEDNTFSMKFGDWVPQDSFHIKSYYTDWPRCTTPVVYKLADEVFRTRGILKDRPYKKYYVGEYSDSANANTQDELSQNMETGAKCVPDGFPVIVYQNGEFWGVNAWQLKKHRDNYMLSKKKATNIHLDGDMGITHQQEVVPPVPTPYVPFWLWDGNINWAVFCSGRAGIEIRNPKNLYCVDGKKYDADTHDAEIITSATAEEWIASGQITPTGKVIDDTLAGYLRATGKVRESIEDLTTYVPTINRLISGGATAAEIRSAIENIFDIDTFIDYIVIGNVVGNNDAWDNNGQIITWGKLEGSDRLNWSVNVYDCDITFGCQWDGRVASAADNTKLGLNYPLYKIFWDYYFDELKTRYHELRDKGIFTAEHITQLFRNWMSRVGYDNYSKEYDKWNESPCFRDGNQTYSNYPTTGGMYGSIYRIYNWIKKRIEYMDANDFFDYSQN